MRYVNYHGIQMVAFIDYRLALAGPGEGATGVVAVPESSSAASSSLGCFSIFLSSFCTSSQASRFLTKIISESSRHHQTMRHYLLTPITMRHCQRDSHITNIRYLLSLEAIQIVLDSNACILQIMGTDLKSVFKLSPS